MTRISVRRFASIAQFDAALIHRLEQAIGAGGAIMLSGGRTPLPAYRELAKGKPRAAAGLRVLYSDDRYVPATSESSNYFQTRVLIDALNLPPGAVARVATAMPLQQAAADYERQLRELLGSSRIGLGLLGLGRDGHTASLFNAASLEQARGHLAIAVDRPDGLQAVSVTPELLTAVAEPLFLVTGGDKHQIVEEFLRSDSTLTARRAVSGCPQAEIWIAA